MLEVGDDLLVLDASEPWVVKRVVLQASLILADLHLFQSG